MKGKLATLPESCRFLRGLTCRRGIKVAMSFVRCRRLQPLNFRVNTFARIRTPTSISSLLFVCALSPPSYEPFCRWFTPTASIYALLWFHSTRPNESESRFTNTRATTWFALARRRTCSRGLCAPGKGLWGMESRGGKLEGTRGTAVARGTL